MYNEQIFTLKFATDNMLEELGYCDKGIRKK